MTLEKSPARRVAVAGVVGALYVVLSLVVAPFVFGRCSSASGRPSSRSS